jgi:hypothetical protein
LVHKHPSIEYVPDKIINYSALEYQIKVKSSEIKRNEEGKNNRKFIGAPKFPVLSSLLFLSRLHERLEPREKRVHFF